MKVYLINPPAVNGTKIVREGRCMQRKGAWTAVWSPISLATIGAVLERDGWTAKLSDCIVEDIDFPRLGELLEAFSPDLVVINAVTPSIVSDLASCRVVKERCPHAVTAVIGIHSTALPAECLKQEPSLDFVVRGEPEMTLCELARVIVAGKSGSGVKGITGLSYRSEGTVVHEADRAVIENLDELPFPAWKLIDRTKYRMPFTDRPFLLVATSRGCPFQCRFCADAAYYGKKVRTRSAKSVVNELAWIKNTFGISEFLFWSESFTINRNFSIAVAREIIAQGLDVSWVCNSRVDNVDREMMELFRKAGCWMIGFGVEAGNQAILDSMKKGITVDQIRRAVTDAKAAGLEVTGHCVLGFPGETGVTMAETVRLTKQLPFDFVQYYCSVPFPGSELFSNARKNGWLITDDWMRYEQNVSVMTTPQLSADEVMRWRSRAYRSFYLRPSIVLKTLRRLTNARELLNFFKMARDFLTWV
jgi:radical SAM superfamily enzyme YgiQ (UPF0313 family)